MTSLDAWPIGMMNIPPSYQSIREGDAFGGWVVIAKPFPSSRAIDGATEWHVPCQCKCGTYRAVRIPQLRNGHSTSCGLCVGGNGWSKRLYNIWRGMLTRCYSDKHGSFKDYGGRGIRVCSAWVTDFKAFRAWAISHGYADKLCMDRINVNGNYEPSNVRWVTHRNNQRNKRSNINITAFGETKCLMDWVNDPRCSSSYTGLKRRIVEVGMSPEDAITDPPTPLGKRRWQRQQVTAFGETKSYTEWANDSRCKVDRTTLRKRIKKFGLRPEIAITGDKCRGLAFRAKYLTEGSAS